MQSNLCTASATGIPFLKENPFYSIVIAEWEKPPVLSPAPLSDETAAKKISSFPLALVLPMP